MNRILVPAAGCSVDAFVVAATRYVANVDRKRFGTPDEILAIFHDREKKDFFWDEARGVYSQFGKTCMWEAGYDAQIGIIGPGILWGLEALQAGDLRVEYLNADGTALGRPRQDGHFSDNVRLRFALDGEQTELLYVQHEFTLGEQKPPPALLVEFIEQGVDGVLEKAIRGLEDHPGYDALLDFALEYMDAERGRIIVDGESTYRGMTRLTDPRFTLLGRVHFVPWGYSRQWSNPLAIVKPAGAGESRSDLESAARRQTFFWSARSLLYAAPAWIGKHVRNGALGHRPR